MNTLSLNILNKIKNCSGGGYAVLSLEELMECAPEGEPVSFDDISQAIAELAEQKYLDIKYSRGDMYCVAAVKDYAINEVIESNEILPEVVQAADDVSYGRLYAICAALSFAGAFVGSFIVCIIFAAVG